MNPQWPSSPPEELIHLTLELAEESMRADEVPVGALVARPPGPLGPEWEVISTGRNRILEKKDPSAHAEQIALREACRILDSERIPGHVLLSTLEPCLMCTGMSILARVNVIYYMAPEIRNPGASRILQTTEIQKDLNHRPMLIHLPAHQDPAADMLRQFFRKKRKTGSEDPSRCQETHRVAPSFS